MTIPRTLPSPSFRMMVLACVLAPAAAISATYTGVQGDDLVVIPKGEHVLSGAYEVPEGKKLEIRPGAVFVVQKGSSLRISGEFLVSGETALPVIFKGARWMGIRTESTARVSVRGLQISGAEFALNIQGPTPKVEECVFAKNVRGLKLDGSGEVVATNCLFVGNTEYGLRFARMTGSIEHCTFSGNKGSGVVLGDASPRFLYCRFNDNGTAGIEQIFDTGLDGAQCSFEGNGIAIATGKKGAISFRGCWWGARTTSFIKAKGVDVPHPAIRTPIPETPKGKKKTNPNANLDPEETLRVSWEGFLAAPPAVCGAMVANRL